MVEDVSRILMVGNGPYANRGCEAIVRGTTRLLSRESFSRFLQVVCADNSVVESQQIAETDPSISHIPIDVTGPARFSAGWIEQKLAGRFGLSDRVTYAEMAPHLDREKFSVVLQVGGDNFTLDYGRPDWFMGLNDFLYKRGLPVVILGASIGPFDEDPDYEVEFSRRIQQCDAIFVRESESLQYLENLGVPAKLMADPAILMAPVVVNSPELEAFLEREPIGVNISPLVLAYRTAEKVSPWSLTEMAIERFAHECAGWISNIKAQTGADILLVPHVSSVGIYNDDFGFLERIRRISAEKYSDDMLPRIPDSLSAAQLKYVISRCSSFIGARTHSTIAALSSFVPTLSIGYSRKAMGINRDLYGHTDYCLNIAELDADLLVAKLVELRTNGDEIRDQLRQMHTSQVQLVHQAGEDVLSLVMRQDER
jgi:colanic acid/amylovoran biosynthesis protein